VTLMPGGAEEADTSAFAASRERLDAIMAWLASEEAIALDLATLEHVLMSEGEKLLTRVLQDCENLRLQEETPVANVADQRL
jgi:hypothetical protein